MTFKKIILDELRAAKRLDIVKKIKSVRYSSYSGGNSLRVESVDLFKEQREYLECLLAKYQYGHFDGMTDSYNYDNRIEGIRQVRFVFLENEFSDGVRNFALQQLKERWDIVDDKTCQEKRRMWLQTAVWQDCCSMEKENEINY